MKYLQKISVAGYLLVFLALASCGPDQEKFRIIYSSDEPIGQIANKMKEIIDRSGEFEAELIIGPGSISNVDSLLKGAADLAIIENHTPVEDSVSAILPFYPQILHILYQSDDEIWDFKKVVEGKKVFIGLEGSGTYRFMKDLFKFFQVDESQVELTDNPFDMEVYCSFGDIIKDENLIGLETFKLFSFDRVERYGKGSIAEAISLKYPQLKPFIIPDKTYRQLTPHPVLTLAVDAVLVSRTQIPTQSIYNLTKLLFYHHQDFNSISPLISIDLTERFDPNILNFPLHEGSRQYLEKDEPSFLERYAELIGVLFSIAIALTSGLLSLTKWRKQTKKDRIDVYYKKIIDIKNDIPKLRSSRDARQKILELQREQDKAFELLIDEKLQANESFRIYMELNKEIIQALVVRAKAFKRLEADSGKVVLS